MKKFAFTLSLFVFSLISAVLGDDLFIDGDLAAALQKAKASDKLVMIDFMAEWCGPCKMLDRTTWKDESVVTSVQDKAVAVKVDVDKQGGLASEYGIRSLPTVVFTNSEGEELFRFIGYRDAEGFLREFHKVTKS